MYCLSTQTNKTNSLICSEILTIKLLSFYFNVLLKTFQRDFLVPCNPSFFLLNEHMDNPLPGRSELQKMLLFAHRIDINDPSIIQATPGILIKKKSNDMAMLAYIATFLIGLLNISVFLHSYLPVFVPFLLAFLTIFCLNNLFWAFLEPAVTPGKLSMFVKIEKVKTLQKHPSPWVGVSLYFGCVFIANLCLLVNFFKTPLSFEMIVAICILPLNPILFYILFHLSNKNVNIILNQDLEAISAIDQPIKH